MKHDIETIRSEIIAMETVIKNLPDYAHVTKFYITQLLCELETELTELQKKV